MDGLSLEHLNHETIKIEELIGKGKNQIPISHVTLDQTSFYASENADISLQLAKTLKARLKDNTLIPVTPSGSTYTYPIEYYDEKFISYNLKDTIQKFKQIESKLNMRFKPVLAYYDSKDKSEKLNIVSLNELPILGDYFQNPNEEE